MNDFRTYDVGIVGGGLAGLSLAILCAKAGYSTVLYEKEKYPFHKVCGEYISLESWDLLVSLGLPLQNLGLPVINELNLSSPDGSMLKQKLPLGGFGISRYMIDDALVKIARASGVVVYDGCRVQDILFEENVFTIVGDKINNSCRVCCGTFGKRSNIDIKWKRDFIQRKPGSLNNFIGVKYHAVTDHPRDTIALHNFRNGYCGISPVENNKTCICYLTTAQTLRDNQSNIHRMEEEVLFRNPFIHEAFARARILYDRPLTISQISFDKKEQVQNHVLMIGDAAGMITPLCGNGMSMALHGSRIAAEHISRYLKRQIDRSQMEANYCSHWNREFANRLMAGRMIQGLFGKEWLTNILVKSLRKLPFATRAIIRQTHG